MIELPEGTVLAGQLKKSLAGKTVTEVFNATSPHKFAFFNGDPALYGPLLKGRKVVDTEHFGMFVDIVFEGDVRMSVGDGVNLRYYDKDAKIPAKYQLLITFDDGSFLVFSVAMYGMIYATEGGMDNKYYNISRESISPLDDRYDWKMFHDLYDSVKKNLSAKALIASQQHIPGVGNGVLQDILFNARINPKRKILTLSEEELKGLFRSLKDTLRKMAEEGGRDTETDIYGNKGGYKSILSKNTLADPCPVCGAAIVKEPYMGGAVYYCPVCQKL